MLTRSLLIPALLAAGLAAAPRASAAPEAAGAAMPDGPERKRIEALMRRAVEAARKEAEAVRSAPGPDPDDRRDAQTQFARILYDSEGCESAVRFVRDRSEILGASVKLLVSGVLRHRDRGCAVALAPFVLERWQDPYYAPAGRIGLKLYAGAVLNSAGKAEGKRIMRDAEARLVAPEDAEARWNARWAALDAYAHTPAFEAYLEYLAGRMVAEPRSYSNSKRNGLFAILAHHDRCDLVERVAKAGPASCDRPKADAKAVYGRQSPSQAEGLKVVASWMGVEQPTLDEQGLQKVLTDRAPWGRVAKLAVFVNYCRWVLNGGPSR